LSNSLRIHEARWAVLQDLGRTRAAGLGVAANGALDQFAYRYGNALVGNADGAVSIETTLTDLVLEVCRDTIAAVTGAQADVRIQGAPAGTYQALAVPAGSVLEVRRIRGGLRSYVIPEQRVSRSRARVRSSGRAGQHARLQAQSRHRHPSSRTAVPGVPASLASAAGHGGVGRRDR
jgi:hypothetical protein